ncbi:tetratricopeptide repeat protein [Acinetobacter beijerinckii]|uniref:tetratricopeptide repeat protein n=1 Tax=Acinetobacter beijerinckii TaxID=262668 RepID=UPI004054AAF5
MKKNFSLLTILILSLNLSACSSPTEREFNKTTELAEQGHANAQIRLAQMYFDGMGTEIDHQQAFIWIKKAADQGDSQAFEWLKAQSVSGNQKAYELIIQILKQDNPLIARWFFEKAQAGDAWSQYTVGWMYDLGKGLIQSPHEAAKWYLKAAKQNYSLAQRVIADKYSMGSGVNLDMSKSLYWYEKAAEQNDVEAQFRLGMFHALNFRNEQHFKAEIARKWLNKAVQNGHKDATTILKQFEQDYAEVQQVKAFESSAQIENEHLGSYN